MIELKITEDANDQRADRYLHKRFDVPKSVVQKWFRNKKVKRDRIALQPSDRIFTGDLLLLYAKADVREKKKPVPAGRTSGLQIVYEDEHLMILYKPPGQLSHAAHGKEYGKNVVDAMIAHLIQSGEYVPRVSQTFTPALVNRLDRNTGGLVIGAKHYEALKVLNQAIRQREIRKYYQALTYGKELAPGTYEGYLQKDEETLTATMGNDGKYVRLDILACKSVGNFHLHTIELHTGRTHQIRAQLQSLGAPIAGDPKYGDTRINALLRKKGFTRQYLVADALEFRAEDPLLAPLYKKTIRLGSIPEYERLLQAARRVV